VAKPSRYTDIEAKLLSSVQGNAMTNIYAKTLLEVNSILNGAELKGFVCSVVESFGLPEVQYIEVTEKVELNFAHVVVPANFTLKRYCLKVHQALHLGLKRR
jgi:hypothetical protein